MAVTDPISDMLTRIRNAVLAKQKTVSFPASGLKKEICRLLVDQKFLRKFVVLEDGKSGVIKALLKYKGGESVIQGLVRVSRPGRRVFSSAENLPKIMQGLGFSILTTPRGVMTDTEARKNNIGGEILCTIW
jgi:small subunit ribosomal protein S8